MRVPVPQYVGLEHVDRRFAWFRRILRAFRERYDRVFPRYWRVDHTLAVKFCQVTAEMLQSQLGASRLVACAPPASP